MFKFIKKLKKRSKLFLYEVIRNKQLAGFKAILLSYHREGMTFQGFLGIMIWWENDMHFCTRTQNELPIPGIHLCILVLWIPPLCFTLRSPKWLNKRFQENNS